jgi:Rrf2 family protein
MALKITKADDYAVRAMIHVACLPEGSVALRHQIADSQGIPPSFSAKILRNLVRARLLRSTRGVNGGFRLARPASEITLLDVIQAIEGPLSLVECTGDGVCSRHPNCPAVPTWRRVQSSIRDILSEASLEALVSMPRRNGRVQDTARGVEAGCALAAAE